MVLPVQVMVWDLEAGGQLAEVTCGEYLNAVCWSPDQAWNQWNQKKVCRQYYVYCKKKFFSSSFHGFMVRM
jgi:hypothetical protein